MKAIFFLALIFGLISCNGQEDKKNNLKKVNSQLNNKTKMEKLDINDWKKRALEYMNKNQEHELKEVNQDTFYYLKDISENNTIVEFSGDDKDGYSMKKTSPLPNLYNKVNFYNSEGNLMYDFKTLIASPNIVIGIHNEYDKNGLIIKKINYDEGFKSSPEDILKILQADGGSIKNELTIIDRDKKNTVHFWYIEFLIPKIKKVKILEIEDGTLKILKEEERDSDFLKD